MIYFHFRAKVPSPKEKVTKKQAITKGYADYFQKNPSPPNDEPEIFVYSPDLNLSFSKLISDI